MSRYEEMMDQRDFYQSEALRFKDDEQKAQAFKMLADYLETQARDMTIGEALR